MTVEKIYISESKPDYYEPMDDNNPEAGVFRSIDAAHEVTHRKVQRELNIYSINPNADNFEAFKESYLKEYADNEKTKLNKFWVADNITVAWHLQNPDSQRFLLTVHDNDLEWIQQYIKPDHMGFVSSDDYPDPKYTRIEINFEGLIADDQQVQINAFRKALEDYVFGEGKPVPQDQDERVIFVAQHFQSIDIANFYEFTRVYQVQPLGNVDKLVLTKIQNDWFDFYAKNTDLPAILGDSGYRALLNCNKDNTVYFNDMAELAHIDGQKPGWLVGLIYSLNDQEKEIVKDVLNHFQEETYCCDFTFRDYNDAINQVSAFVDPQSGLVCLKMQYEDGTDPLVVESINDGEVNTMSEFVKKANFTNPIEQSRAISGLNALKSHLADIAKIRPEFLGVFLNEFNL